MRLVFMGSAPIAVPTLDYLYGKHDVAAVVTQPDKPKGRKREPMPTAVKAEALRLGLLVLEPRKLRASEFVDGMKALNPEVIVVMAYGRLVPPDVLYLPPHGCVNIHGSILPRHRGPCPIERAIMLGDRTTGVTTFYMNEGFDTGDIILTRPLDIASDDTGGSLRDKMSKLAVEVIDETLRRLGDGTAPRIPQDLGQGCHAAVIVREDARIDWCQPAAVIDCQVRACDPEPGAFTVYRGQPVKVRRVAVIDGHATEPPGTIVAADREAGLQVAAGQGTVVALLEVQPAGKRWMQAHEFLTGYRPRAGESLLPVPSLLNSN